MNTKTCRMMRPARQGFTVFEKRVGPPREKSPLRIFPGMDHGTSIFKNKTAFMAAAFFLFTVMASQASEIHEAAKAGKLSQIKGELSRDREQLNARDHLGYTPLHWALIRANWPVAVYLLQDGANPSLTGDDGATTLHCAANHDNAEIIAQLTARGVDPNLKNTWGNTPLALAVQRGCGRAAKALISHGADMQTATEEGWTPLHLAYRSGQKELQKILIELGADEHAADRSGRFPIDLNFVRPSRWRLPQERYREYTGKYDVGNGFTVKVFQRGKALILEDYARDEIYPIAPDTFYDLHEPWKIRFYRDCIGRVDKIVLDFQTVTVIGKKTSLQGKNMPGPKLGVETKSLETQDVSNEQLRKIWFEWQGNPCIQLVTRVSPGSVAEKAGLQPGDILFELNNSPLREPGDLRRLLLDVAFTDRVALKVLRRTRFLFLTASFE